MPMRNFKKHCDIKVKQANGKDHSDIFLWHYRPPKYQKKSGDDYKP